MADPARVRAGMYRFLAMMFLTPIPVEGSTFAERLQAAIAQLPAAEADGAVGEGFALLRQHAAQSRGRDLAEVQRELAVDRTRLVRGLAKEDGPPPPYEAVYRPGLDLPSLLGTLADAYREGGCAPPPDLAERADFIGVELSFMERLCEQEAEGVDCRSQQIRFLEEHLTRWVPAYCGQMERHARTTFFCGFARLLAGVMNQERSCLSRT